MLTDERLAELNRLAADAGQPWEFGVAPEEPDTILIGSDGIIWGRIVGSPGRPVLARVALVSAARVGFPELVAEVLRLRAAVRRHRDYRGDDRCWMDDEELYKALPEGYTPPPRDSRVELANCEKFIACRHNPGTEYVSPEREIDRLRAELRGTPHRWVRTWETIDPEARYVVSALNGPPGGLRIAHPVQLYEGWEVKRLTEGCYAALPCPPLEGHPSTG